MNRPSRVINTSLVAILRSFQSLIVGAYILGATTCRATSGAVRGLMSGLLVDLHRSPLLAWIKSASRVSAISHSRRGAQRPPPFTSRECRAALG